MLVLVYVFLTARIIKLSPTGHVPTPLAPISPQFSDAGIGEIIRKRGYNGLVVKIKRGTGERRK